MLNVLSKWFDRLEDIWETPRRQRITGSFIVLMYILSIVVIEINQFGWMVDRLRPYIPASHLSAIQMAFTLLLVFEVIGLVLSIVRSVSVSVGKQFQIFSLILLRDTFNELSHFTEPLVWSEISLSLRPIVSTACGALLIFVVLGVYSRVQRPRSITRDEQDTASFIVMKKVIALFLLVSFIGICLSGIYGMVVGNRDVAVFGSFYTLLIFCDILIVLISLRYSSSYHVAFRNSGYAVATVLIRIALLAPLEICAALGFGASVFALGITFAYNTFAPDLYPEDS